MIGYAILAFGFLIVLGLLLHFIDDDYIGPARKETDHE